MRNLFGLGGEKDTGLGEALRDMWWCDWRALVCTHLSIVYVLVHIACMHVVQKRKRCGDHLMRQS